MDELTAISHLLAEPPPPAPEVVAGARTRLERAARGTGTSRWHAPRRPWWLAAAAGLAAAVAAGCITAQVTGSGVASPAGVLTVHEVADRAAAVAGRQPQVRPGQWVYWKEARSKARSSIFEVWTTADSTKAAFIAHGRVRPVDLAGRGDRQYIGQPEGSSLPGSGTFTSGLTGTVPVPYADLGSLPRSPQALLRYLANLPLPHRSGWGPAPAREFVIIDYLLVTYVMPPRLTAELYRALGGIPGVTVNDHAVDVAGRPGIGVTGPALPGGVNMEIIFSPRSYRLMGDDLLGGPRHERQNGTAILQTALVPGPGARP